VLATDHTGQALVTLPDSLGRQAFEAWIKALPDSNSPSWIGLPATAEAQLKTRVARRVLANLTLLQGTGGDSGSNSSSNSSSSGSAGEEGQGSSSGDSCSSAREQHDQQLQAELRHTAQLVAPWIEALPAPSQLPAAAIAGDSLSSLSSSAASLPIERWLARELLRGSTVVTTVREDLLSIRYPSLTTHLPWFIIYVFFLCLLLINLVLTCCFIHLI
jgi:hypothetical protein